MKIDSDICFFVLCVLKMHNESQNECVKSANCPINRKHDADKLHSFSFVIKSDDKSMETFEKSWSFQCTALFCRLCYNRKTSVFHLRTHVFLLIWFDIQNRFNSEQRVMSEWDVVSVTSHVCVVLLFQNSQNGWKMRITQMLRRAHSLAFIPYVANRNML